MTDVMDILPLAALSAFMVGLSKGGLTAFAGLAVPILALKIDPLTAAALLLPIYLVADVFGIWAYRRSFSSRNLAIMIPAGLLGVLIGYLAAPYLSVAWLNIGLALVGLSYCARVWFGGAYLNRKRDADLPRGIFWGTLAGITSFISHSGAVPYQMYVLPQKLPKLVFAGSVAITFAVINLSKLPTYFALGQFPTFELIPTTVLVVAAILGSLAGLYIVKRAPEQLFYKAVEIALFLVSLRLLWKGIADLA